MNWAGYERSGGCHDGYLDADHEPRAECREIVARLERLRDDGLRELNEAARLSLLNQGITFTVYADSSGTEKILPFDPIPRIVPGEAWRTLEAGITQRLRALNLFLADLYGDQKILKDGIVPTDLVVQSPGFCREMSGLRPPGDVYVHVSGIDLIQDEHGRYLVLEDNLRIPSGVSYLIENRLVMSRIVPDLMERYHVRPVDAYPQLLLDALRSLDAQDAPRIAVLTPGIYNSAYFEHSFLAAQMGVLLVEGTDLVVDDDVLYVKTTDGLQRIDVLYRRVDDAFLDPVAFRSDSVLGVPGLMHAYRAGHVALANAPGTGVADDKAMYAYIPEVIRYYLAEEPLLGQIPTLLCRKPDDRAFVLEHLDELVVKLTDGAGGHGMLIGSSSTAEERSRMSDAIRADPSHFIAQPIQKLSTLPTVVEQEHRTAIGPRHVDLRPFAVCSAGQRVDVLPGGLTRVAMEEGSLVVNSSRGGGSKDTWVLHEAEEGARAQ